MKIDFVITWVDGNDPDWLAEKSKYSPVEKKINDKNRYRDNNLFQYWFRSVERYAPWVNRIYIVTAGHLPEWLDTSHPKLVHVTHEEFIPSEYLPTFNSNVIELNIHRIKGLSEHFVLFNDDVFLNGPTTPENFFINGLPTDYGMYSLVVPIKEHSITVFNNVRIINENFRKRETFKKNWKKFIRLNYGMHLYRTMVTLPWENITGYYNPHLTTSIKKSTMEEIWEKEFNELDKTSKNKFRTSTDVMQWLVRYWQIEKGEFYPQKLSFGKYFDVSQLQEIVKTMKNERYKILVVNDVTDMEVNIDENLSEIQRAFNKKFPEKSKFEKVRLVKQ